MDFFELYTKIKGKIDKIMVETFAKFRNGNLNDDYIGSVYADLSEIKVLINDTKTRNSSDGECNRVINMYDTYNSMIKYQKEIRTTSMTLKHNMKDIEFDDGVYMQLCLNISTNCLEFYQTVYFKITRSKTYVG